MLTTDRAANAGRELQARFPEAIVVAGDAEWDAARMAFNLVVDQHPEAVARPRSAAETAEIVRAAAELGLRVHAQGSAHNASPIDSLAGTLLIRLERMKAVEIDAEARIARVEAGARWWDVVPQASELGLSALHGSSPEINVVGYSLGGGIGWQARKHGMQANAITAIDAVTADGELRRVDAGNEPDLFWALRGGSGNFAVVTAVEFRLFPAPDIFAGMLFYPFEQGAEVLDAWSRWTRIAPEEATTAARLLQFPPLEEIPEIVRGKSFAIIDGAFLGSEEDGIELLRPLRDLGPVTDTFAVAPPAALSEIHMDPVDPVPYLSAHALLGDLSAAAIDDGAEIAATGSVPIFELRHTGGALARTAPDHGATASLPGEYMMFAGTPVMDPALVPEIEVALARMDDAFAGERVGRYLNFTERPADVATMFPAATLERLREVKSRYDPDGVIRANHEVAANGA